MEKDKFQELMEAKALADQQLEKMRTPVTILFSDIKGSTTYYEKKGDIAGMAMIERHNSLLFPAIQENGGRVVKTIGDSIMACFVDPVGAIRGGVAIQRALEADRRHHEVEEQIHVKVGIHSGLGLLKDDDIFGDVVNAAARVQQQAQADQILITEFLLDAARTAGVQCANFGKAELRGKDEPIDVYAVAWSESATEQLIDDIQGRFEAKLREAKSQYDQLEEEFERARDQWRLERRKLTAEIDRLEEDIGKAKEGARAQASNDLQSEIQFQLEEAIRARSDLQEQMAAAEAKWQSERNNLKAQITSMQASAIEAMERSNNPSRAAFAIREQVEARLQEAKHEWNLQWEGERRRLTAELERVRKVVIVDDKKEAARRAVLEKMGRLPSGSATPVKSAEQWQKELDDARTIWDLERDQLTFKVERLENELQRSAEVIRTEVHNETRSQFEGKVAEANGQIRLLEQEIQSLTRQLSEEQERLNGRVQELERTIPVAQEAARKQVTAQLEIEFNNKLEEFGRTRARTERRLSELTEELDSERRRTKRHITQLEEQLREAKEAAFRAQRLSRGNPGSDV